MRTIKTRISPRTRGDVVVQPIHYPSLLVLRDEIFQDIVPGEFHLCLQFRPARERRERIRPRAVAPRAAFARARDPSALQVIFRHEPRRRSSRVRAPSSVILSHVPPLLARRHLPRLVAQARTLSVARARVRLDHRARHVPRAHRARHERRRFSRRCRRLSNATARRRRRRRLGASHERLKRIARVVARHRPARVARCRASSVVRRR